MAHDPVVFISSTSDDLKGHREQAAKAALASGFAPHMMEYFPASGDAPSLPACLEEVAKAEVVVALVAHRYGWVPEAPENPDKKSITWLECEHAWQVTKKEVLAFLVDPDYPWPAELREDYRLVKERKKAGIAEEVDVPAAGGVRVVPHASRHAAGRRGSLSGPGRPALPDPDSCRGICQAAGGRPITQTGRFAGLDCLLPGKAYLKALEDDTRQIRITGLMTYGSTREEAIGNTEKLAIEVIADRIKHGELRHSALSQ
jgi:hypothetical protein